MESPHVTALRILVDEYEHAEYELGTHDCCTFAADYLKEIGVDVDWDRDSQAVIGNDERTAKTLRKALGERSKVNDQHIGDVVLCVNGLDIPLLGVRGGTGIFAMVEEKGLMRLHPQTPVKGVWRHSG